VRIVDETGYGGTRMIENHPERHAWGLGRHAASANYLWYLRTPLARTLTAQRTFDWLDDQIGSSTGWAESVGPWNRTGWNTRSGGSSTR
jgi:hypothetical protein